MLSCENYNIHLNDLNEQEGGGPIDRYSESRLMLSPVNVIIRLMWSLLSVPFTNADELKTTG